LSHNTKKDDVVVVVANAPNYSTDLTLATTHIQEIQMPIIFQLDDLYNINNIIISETIMLSEEKYIDDEYDEFEYDEEEYIEEDNDPQNVLIVPKDDYVTNDGEVKAEHEKILAIPMNTISSLSNHDFEREESVLNALRKGEFRNVWW